MSAPTPEQSAKEAAVLYTALADLVILFFQIVFAIATQSLTLISETARLGLMLLIEFISLFVLRAVHRDQLRKYRFGIGKVEQFCNLVVGACLVFSGFWVANRVLETLLYGGTAATPLGLATAAIVCAANTLVNLLGWLAMVAARRADDSAIFRAQLRARSVKLVSSLFVQFTLTAATLTKDPVISVALDGLGAGFVACLMVIIGLKMMAESGPDLLDRPAPAAFKSKITETLDALGVAPHELRRTRTRLSGKLPQVELALALFGSGSLAELHRRVDTIQRQVTSRIRDVDVTVVVDEATEAGS